jgi:hypothetical protein
MDIGYSKRKKSPKQSSKNTFALVMGLLGNRAEVRLLFDENNGHLTLFLPLPIFGVSNYCFHFFPGDIGTCLAPFFPLPG